MSKLKQRDSNVELLRIYAMFFITWGHVCSKVQGVDAPPLAFQWLTGLVGTGTVDIFILITGFFLINKTDISLHRFVKVLVPVIFYNVAIVAVLVIVGIAPPSELLTAAYPLGPSKFNLWFVSQYIALILLQPMLSRFIARFSHRQYIGFLTLLVCLTATLAPIFPWGYLYSSPWKVTWFITLFFTGGYLRRYAIHSLAWWKPALAYVAVSSVYFLLVKLQEQSMLQSWDLGSYNSLTTFAIAIAAMTLAVNTHIGHVKIINYIASSTFAVYIIHQNPYVINWLMDYVPQYFGNSCYEAFFTGAAVTAIIFMLCVGVDKLRIWLFYIFGIERLENFIADQALSLVRRIVGLLASLNAKCA